MLFGITMLKTFVMTTLDSATRITRYIAGELFGDTFGIKVLKNRYVSTLLVGVCAGALALGNWQAIWPVFGAANQLIAAMVLIVATVYLITRRRPSLFVAVPAALILVTTIGALVYQIIGFVSVPEGQKPNYMLTAVAALLICLGLFVVYRGTLSIVAARREQASSPEEPTPQDG
jgi:carbon starvation protein